MRETVDYVVVEWVQRLPVYPRYSFATAKHAEELGENVHWLERCPSMESAAARASRLNASADATSTWSNEFL